MTPSFHTPQILLVEENPLFGQMIQNMARILGAECVIVTKAEDALRLYQQHYDLVLLDLCLSSINGFELAQKMRATDTPSGKRIPIIGNATVSEPDRIEALSSAAGIDAVCQKISSIQELYVVLSRWLACPLVMPIHLLDVHVPVAIEA